jgi:formamidopyrimidine-DNA glycosylase
MPELPEVETTRRGIQPFVEGKRIEALEVREPRLRWPVEERCRDVIDHSIEAVKRRGKYIIMHTAGGNLIWHLGMSGSMRILPTVHASADHEHVCLQLDDGNSLRFRDPRRFGALLYCEHDPLQHPLLARLGPEPLSPGFNPDYLQAALATRSGPIKNQIMNSQLVVGVGNIYACESLYRSRINPRTRANRISLERLQRLTQAIKQTLQQAIEQGGTTLRDFTSADGKPGYFRHALQVYAREGLPCPGCGRPVKRLVLGQRSTFYCSQCQR